MAKHESYCPCPRCDERRTQQFRKKQERSNRGGSNRRTQSRDNNATVEVSGGYDRHTHGDYSPEAQRTDFEIFDKTGPNGVEKTHLSIDTDGNKTVWNGNKDFES